ncbi:MAG: TolC family protein [Anaerolineae bacterium]|nr:TolC family protein [Gemmatimonadaceae bacterium]
MEIREKLLAAAATVYAEAGYRGATTRRIAQEAGVNEITLFRHFGSKDALILEATREHGVSCMPLNLLPLEPLDPERELIGWCRAHFAFLHERRSLIRTSMGEMTEHPDMARGAANCPAQPAMELRAYFERLRERGLASDDFDAHAATWMLMAVVFADAMWRGILPEMYGDSSDKALTAYVRLAMRAIGAPQASGVKPKARARKRVARAATAVLLIALGAGALHSQTPTAAPVGVSSTATQARELSLDEALGIAERASEDIAIARAGVTRARGELYRARSEFFPQIAGSLLYTRTLDSEFRGLDAGPADSRAPCKPFVPAGSLTADQRLDSLERALALATDCRATGGGFDFSSLPFGRANAYTLGLTGSQTLFSGGRVTAQARAANAGRRAANISLSSSRAQVILDVTQAYYDAVLAGRLYVIAESTLEQAETTLRHTQLARQVGTQPEFDLLRAQVTRDNQRPVVVARRTDRELAYLRLKQLLDLRLDHDVVLTTGLGDSLAVAPTRLASLTSTTPDTATSARAPVRQAAENVAIQENLKRIARAQRLPTVSVSSVFGRVGYPIGGLPSLDEFRTNWTVGVNLSVPIFTGGRIRGDELVAEANLTEGRLLLEQTRELAELDTRSALAELEAAEATWAASGGTASQAARAYNIAEIRYREGISTQTELSESRILLQQAQANRAVASRDLQVARARVALLRDLPIGAFGVSRTARGASQQSRVPSEQQQQQRPSQASVTQASQTGAGLP